MNKKVFLTTLLILLFVISMFTYSFAANSTASDVRNTVMDAGNTIGDTIMAGKNTVVDGTKNLVNGTANLGKSTMNTEGNTEGSMPTTGNSDYTATRTATDAGNLGMTTNGWTWLILGIVGIVIIALVWYYGAQYEHKNYTNE